MRICSENTYSSNLLATAMALGVSKSDLEMVGEVVVVCWCKLVKEFF